MRRDLVDTEIDRRSFIRRRLMGQAEEPMPGQQTSET
jgi:hypothetical protein